MGKRDRYEPEKHPSYGMVGFSRVSHGGGHTKLFGSALHDHHNTVILRIKRGEVQHNLGRDWTRGTDQLIEVELSASQFSELLTTMNISDGVPCTIRSIGYERVESPPEEAQQETEKVRESFAADMKDLASNVKQYLGRAQELLKQKKALTVTEKDEVLDGIRGFLQEIESNIPFMQRQFHEASEKVVTQSKAEIEAFALHSVITAGIDALKEKQLAEGKPTAPKLPLAPAPHNSKDKA